MMYDLKERSGARKAINKKMLENSCSIEELFYIYSGNSPGIKKQIKKMIYEKMLHSIQK